MRCFLGIICGIMLAWLPAAYAADEDEGGYPDVPPPPALKSYTGISWGAVHTIWNGAWNNEGYPEAGTLGPMVSLRKVNAVNKSMAIALYLSYYIMRSRTSVNTDSTADGTVTLRTYFREIDLGLNLHASPWASNRNWYVGGGPSVRWGQAGKRIGLERRPGSVRKAAWFGLTVLTGYRIDWGESRAIFFEPQLTFSPDMADRWQRNYPPETFSLQMGLLW